MTQENALTHPDAARRRFESMLAEVRRRVYSMALHLTRNRNDAEDLVQETLIKAWRGFDTYVPGRPFVNWVLRIMQRAYLDERRRANPIRRAESLCSMVSPSDGELQEIPVVDESPTPDAQVLQMESAATVHAMLARLPAIYRDAILMCDVDEMSYKDIAEVQGTTVGTVRSRIHRGRKQLRAMLIEHASHLAA